MIHSFETKIINLIHEFTAAQEVNLRHAANAVADCIAQGGKFYTIGSGHSHMIGEELYARAGGLACIDLIAPMELTLGSHPAKSTHIERIAEYAHVIIMQYKIKKGDIVMISSNSGRNRMPVEMALELKRRGIKTIAFTNLEHSKHSASRHPSGKNLYEICDYVIDNCGCPGDACMKIDGVNGRMGSTSSIIGMYMAQLFSMMLAEELAKRNLEVPVFLSANVDDGDAWNERIMKHYYHI